MEELRRGARSAIVRLLQHLLNKGLRTERLSAAPLELDGRFGRLTEEAVRAFQTRHSMTPTGVADTRLWRAIGLSVDVWHQRVPLIGQPTDSSCWAAAAAMILGNMSPNLASSHIGEDGGLQGSIEHHQAFAQSLGWEMPMRTPGVNELIALISRGPLWIRGSGEDWAHAVVLSGVFGDGTADGTMVRIHDPWPPRHGRVYGAFLDDLYVISEDGGTATMTLDYVLIPR